MATTAELPQGLARAIAMLGDTYVLGILCQLSRGNLRFNELQRALGGVNPTTLSDRLKKLEREEILHREVETIDKLSVQYVLTEKGRALLPITTELRRFASQYYHS